MLPSFQRLHVHAALHPPLPASSPTPPTPIQPKQLARCLHPAHAATAPTSTCIPTRPHPSPGRTPMVYSEAMLGLVSVLVVRESVTDVPIAGFGAKKSLGICTNTGS